MGDRAQIAVKMYGDKDEKVYLYTHWGGSRINQTLAAALNKRMRWGDEEYLARIIFCEMVRGEEDGETGYGIGVSAHGDIEYPIPVLDCETQTITFEQPEWDHNQVHPLPGPFSFESFVGRYLTEG